MLVPVAWPVAVALDVAAWVVAGVAVGWWWARRPASSFTGSGPVLRLRAFERDGTWYERVLHVRAWRGRLPEAGTWFGGASKRHLPPGGIERFARESARAECVHWTLVALVPLFALWNPPGLFAVMVAYAAVANLPCIVVTRYHRARVAGIQRRHP